MRIEKIPKKVFGSDEEFVRLRLLYNNGYDKFKREELSVILEVFNVLSTEQRNKLILEDFEYQIMEEELDKNSVKLRDADCVFELYFPCELDSKSVFRRYGDFYISFLKLDDNHLATRYWFENVYFPNHIYPYKEYFEFKNRLYKIIHRLDYDLLDDYPQTAEDLTNVVAKDKLVLYLKCLMRRHGKSVYVWIFKPDHIIRFLDFMYPNRGVGLFELMKTRMIEENLPLGATGKVEGWDIEDFIRLIYLSKEFYNLNKEV
jgi:hypothetical protein